MYYYTRFIHEEKQSKINIQILSSHLRIVMKDLRRFLSREVIISILDHLYLSEIIILSIAVHLPLPVMYLGMTQELTALGNIPLLEYFKNQGYAIFFPYLAGKFKMWHVLGWYKEIDEKNFHKLLPYAIEGVSETDDIPIMEWCLENQQGNRADNRAKAVREAVKNGSLNLIKHFGSRELVKKDLKILVEKGYLHILRWVQEDGTSMREGMILAIIKNQLEIVKWIDSLYGPWKPFFTEEQICKISKNKEMFEFLQLAGYI